MVQTPCFPDIPKICLVSPCLLDGLRKKNIPSKKDIPRDVSDMTQKWRSIISRVCLCLFSPIVLYYDHFLMIFLDMLQDIDIIRVYVGF